MNRHVIVITTLATLLARCTGSNQAGPPSDAGDAAVGADGTHASDAASDACTAPLDGHASAPDGASSNDVTARDVPAIDAPPGPPGCGLNSAAFCDPFNAPSTVARGRAGELNAQWWSAGRNAPQSPTSGGQGFAVSAATLQPTNTSTGSPVQLPACRTNLPAVVEPDQDTLICDPSSDIQSNYLLVAVASQNYGQNSYRVRQPFDFAGRTGKIVFDTEAVPGGLLGWVSLDVTEDPIPVPSYKNFHNDEGGSLPRSGFEVQFGGCTGSATMTVAGVHVFTNYTETILSPPQGNQSCVPYQWGQLQHFEIDVSQQNVTVFGTPASPDGVTFGTPVMLFSTPVTLPFSRGYVHITTHNHATMKYSAACSGFQDGFLNLDAWIARWDNVGFDGPVIAAGREYDVADSLTTGQYPLHDGNTLIDSVNTGWPIPDQMASPSATPVLHFTGVDLTGVTSASLSLTAWYCVNCLGTGQTIGNMDLRYRLNGNAWHDRMLNAGEINYLEGNTGNDPGTIPQGSLDEMLDVPISELVAGDNTLEFQAQEIPENYPPGVANIDLILSTQ